MIEKPTCPNCGSYIYLGNHSCSCETTYDMMRGMMKDIIRRMNLEEGVRNI